MSKLSLSLKARQILIFVGIILLVLPTILLSIEQAFERAQIKALEQQLEAYLYTLIGEIDLDSEQVGIVGGFLPPILNQVDSGTLAILEQDGKIIWQSDSALAHTLTISQRPKSSGEKLFVLENGFWRYSYSLFFENSFGTQNLMLHVMQQQSVLESQVAEFGSIILRWFLVIALVLVLASAVALLSTLWPIERLDAQIKAVEQGEKQEIEGHFPKELARVKADLNLLLNSQERQKNRYRSSLSDLTHALKTPVAVMRSSKVSQDPQVAEQLDRITNIIEHQLRRAASGGEDVWKKKTEVEPIVQKLHGVMTKIYADKNIVFSVNTEPDVHFYGDEADLMEIVGNLLDNACKACQGQVSIKAVQQSQQLHITVEDDGPGIDPKQKEQLLIRGKRLDTYTEGHGVGMAIVHDLVVSYQGHLQIEDSALGGAKFVVHFG